MMERGSERGGREREGLGGDESRHMLETRKRMTKALTMGTRDAVRADTTWF